MVSMHCASQVTLVEAFLLFRNTSACKGNGLCVHFFYLCLSRACLGKLIIFSIKWL
jgi:hypothetical protein